MSIPSYARHLLQAAVLTFTPALCAQAATVLPDEYDRMQEQALRQGHVPVHVVLTNTAPQEALKNPEGFAAATRNQANSLLVELGDQAHTYGLRISPLGSMDVWVSAHGLQTLNSSRTAISLSPGPQWYHHTLLSDSDGSLSAIDALLEKQDGFAEVEVTLYVEGTGFNIDSVSGRGALRIATAAQEQEATERAQQVLAHLGLDFASPPGLSNPTGTASLIDAGAVKRTGALALKTHRLALASLANHPAMRAIKPVGYTDPRPAWIDPDALREAARSGSAEVLVQLRSPFVGGQLSPSTYQAQMQSNQRMLDELLAPYKPLRKPQSFALLGAASAVLSQPDLERLATNRDARLQGLLVNKPMYKPSLATSTATMNLPPYWSSGYTGAGQTIVIVDTGIEKAHAMLKSAGGTSRVTFEACYQTDTVLDGKTYHSDCPGKNTHGDSPPGLTGSGEPIAESLCLAIGGALFRDVYCNHGTHVGGIAAGRYSALMSPSLQGVAPDSSIASINIASRHTDNFSIFPVDLIAVLDTLSNAITATPGNSPFVINMSLGGMPQSAPSGLNGDALNTFGNAVTALKTAAVPVVAAMGNLGLTYEMDLPAAVQGVIKVGAVENDGAGLTISPFSNRVQPAYWGGEYIFFAPGGTDYVHGILSAKAYTAAKNGSYVIPGTSMAAPHVSGLYSLLKAAFPAATQDQHSNFIRDFLSENFSGYACNPSGVSCGSTPFKSIKMP